MALSGSVTTDSYKSRSVTLNWSATQSIANNTSTITWELVGSGGGGYVVVSELKVTIDGSQAYYRGPSNHTDCYVGTVLASGTTVVPHKNDGSKSFTISVQAGIYNWAVNCSGSNTFTLNTIARASTISSAANITLGNSCAVKWTPASASFRYKLKFALGGYSYTTDDISPGTTSAYTYLGYKIPVIVANNITNSTTGTMTVYLYTYNGSTQIGSTSSTTFTVSIPSNVIPTLRGLTVTVDNSANSVVAGWGLSVVGYSKAKLVASASGIYGSSISSFVLSGAYTGTVNGSSLNYTGGVLSSSGQKTFSVTARDSRGRVSTALSKSITVYAYSQPVVTAFVVERGTADAKKVTVRANWSFSSVNGKNAATATLYYKRSTSSAWIVYGEISRNTGTTLTVDFDEEHSYNFRVRIEDSIGNAAQDESFISTASVLLDFRAGGKGLGIGKIAETDSLEIALDTVFMGDVYVQSGASKIPLATYIKNIINGG